MMIEEEKFNKLMEETEKRMAERNINTTANYEKKDGILDEEKIKLIEKQIHLGEDNVKMIQQRNYELRQRMMEKSISEKKQKIKGELYVNKDGREKVKITVGLIVAALGISGLVYGFNENEKLGLYNKVLNEKMEQELTDEQISAYNRDQEKNSAIANYIDKHNEIKEAKDSLDSIDYNILGDSLILDKEYIKQDSSYTISEKTQDAIDVATDKVIEEYKGRVH